MRRRYVSFTLGSGRFCVPVDQVVQIVRAENILDVPKAPFFVDGVINLRGDVVPVVNLRARLGIGREPPAVDVEELAARGAAAFEEPLIAEPVIGEPAIGEPVPAEAAAGGADIDSDDAGVGSGGVTAGRGSHSNDAPRARIMVTRIGDHSYGLTVDEVSEIVEIDDDAVEREAAERFGLGAGLVVGSARRESGTYVILDLPRLLSPGRELSSPGRT